MSLFIYFLGLAAGIAVLAWSADIFVDGAAGLARRCGLSPLLVGMLVIGFGTSAPELMVSFLSALDGNPSIALGNAYGSNVANIGLILGLTAAISPIAVADGVLRRDLPVLVGVTLASGALLPNGVLSRGDGLILLLLFAVFLALNIRSERRRMAGAPPSSEPDEASAAPPWRLAAQIGGGLVLLAGSSQLLVKCAVHIARSLGVSDLVVGLTVVAVGTSLPELASSLAAIRRHEHDLALGNIVGSNFFNTLAVVGLAAVTRPIVGSEAQSITYLIRRDYPVMLGATLLLLVFCVPSRRGARAVINRLEGAVMLAVYLGYVAYLVAKARA